MFLAVKNHWPIAPHGVAMTSSGNGLTSNSLMPYWVRPIAPGARFSLRVALSAVDVFDSIVMASAPVKRRTKSSMPDSLPKMSWLVEQPYAGGAGARTCSEYVASAPSARYLRVLLAKAAANCNQRRCYPS